MVDESRKKKIREVIGLIRMVEKDLLYAIATHDPLESIDSTEIASTRLARALTQVTEIKGDMIQERRESKVAV